MRVLRILNELRPSGVEATLRATAPLWEERGVRIEVLSTGSEVGPYAPELRAVGYPVHHVPLEPVAPFLRSFRDLLRRQERFDIVHLHAERANFPLAVAARAVGVRHVVRSIHNVFAFDGRLRAERTAQRAALRALGVAHVSVGDSVARNERDRFRNRTVRIYNAYDDGRFVPPTEAQRAAARERLGLAPDRFVVGLAGNCSPVKAHATAFAAVGSLVAAGRDIEVLHAGIENDAVTRERASVETLGLRDRVHFLGFVPDLTSVLHACDAYVMPSRYEGLGNAALEALACGVPAVLTDVPGLRDLIPAVGPTEWVRPDVEEVAGALGRLQALGPDERRRRGQRNHDEVCRRFARARHVDGYHALYRSLLP